MEDQASILGVWGPTLTIVGFLFFTLGGLRSEAPHESWMGFWGTGRQPSYPGNAAGPQVIFCSILFLELNQIGIVPIGISHFQFGNMENRTVDPSQPKLAKIRRLKHLFTLLDLRPENQTLAMTTSTISMCQNRAISFFNF